MSREYCFNLSVPLSDFATVDKLLEETRQRFPQVRISRKPDREGQARFYLSFPFSGTRLDLTFQEWFTPYQKESWDLFGPNPGRWGLV